ncbi:CHASE domain-containing protein [bacterium]|nr:CHASE domain-containing protein [bacterium]MBU1994175.1 CHASE domain-containing protein [bacterium]
MNKNKIYLISSIILLVGFIISFTVFSLLHQAEINKAKGSFIYLSGKYANSIKHTLEHTTHVFESLLAIHSAHGYIKRDEFSKFTHIVLKKYPDIQMIEWIPEVKKEEKTLYIQKAVKDGFKNFSFTQLGNNGDIVPAEEREYYYPVYYVEPYKGNEKALGFDTGTIAQSLQALTIAKNSGNISMTSPFRLVYQEQQNNFLLYCPVYKNADRLEHFEGLYAITMNVDNFISHSIENIDNVKGLSIRIYDIDASSESNMFYSKQFNILDIEVPEISSSVLIEFFGHRWKIEVVANETFVSEYTTYFPWFALFFIIVLTALISLLYYVFARRYAVMSESNEELRRFGNIAIGREERIITLKEEINLLKEQLRSRHES